MDNVRFVGRDDAIPCDPPFPRYTIYLLHQLNAALRSHFIPFSCSTWLITDVYASASLLRPEHLLEDYRVKRWLQFHPVSWPTTWWQAFGNGSSVFLHRKPVSAQSQRIRASFPGRRVALASSPCRLGSVGELSEGHHETTVTTQAASVARHCAVPSLRETWETRRGV